MKSDSGIQRKRERCRKKFLYFFPKGFADPKYQDWERNYKWDAHQSWNEKLNQKEFKSLLRGKEYKEVGKRAANLESKTNLLFSFEKMALRDAVKPAVGAEKFAHGLYDYIYGSEAFKNRFLKFAECLAQLPRKQTRVLTWPLQTVFAFIARPDQHVFMKPRVTQVAAEKYGYDFFYQSRPNWETYQSLLSFAELIRHDVKDLNPRDFIDLQSFIWVLGSDEYVR